MRELKGPAGVRGALGRGTQGETSRKKKAWFPAWAAVRRPDRFTLLLAAAAALGAGLVFLRLAGYGPGMPWGAVNSIAAGKLATAIPSAPGRTAPGFPKTMIAELKGGRST